MCWHASARADVHRMVHPSDGESWKHFDRCHPNFASESRNVRFGLSTDGFNPWGMSTKQYSVWPIMVTPYNLPPWLCMKTRFIWLTILIPGPSNPKKRLDIYLKHLIDDLVHLWNVGVDTYNANRKQSFTLRAALMWTVSDFPAYAMLSGWSTQGKLGCPYCMDYTKTFVLKTEEKCRILAVTDDIYQKIIHIGVMLGISTEIEPTLMVQSNFDQVKKFMKGLET
ncbi:unnamed protein product [Rhodiola kirilowii]